MASSGATIRVTGLREVQRAFAEMDSDLKREMLEAGKAAAEPVAADSRAKISKYRGASTGTIVPRASVAGAFVTQRARKVTGLRGDFGALEMRKMMEALDENTEEIVRVYDLGLERLMAGAGF